MKAFKLIITLIFLFFFTFHFFLWAKDPPEKNSYTTIFFNLKSINCPEEVSQKINTQLTAKLETIPYLKLVSDKEIEPVMKIKKKNINCYSKKCAFKYGKKLSAHRVIYGRVSKETKKYLIPLGSEGAEKYLIQVDKKDYYTIELSLIDTLKKKKLMSEKTIPFEIHDLSKWTERLKTRIERYYEPLSLRQIFEFALDIFNFSPAYFSSAFSAIIPQGRLETLSNFGYGLNLKLGFRNQYFYRWNIWLNSGFYFMNPENVKINSFIAIPLSVQMGYTFLPYRNFSLTPLIGIGYNFQFIKNFNGTSNVFIDPITTVEAELNYQIYHNYSVYLISGYALLFEKTSEKFITLGRYINIQLGIKRML